MDSRLSRRIETKHRWSQRAHPAFGRFRIGEASFRGEKRDQRRPLLRRINIVSSSQSPRTITGSSPRLTLEFRRPSLLPAPCSPLTAHRSTLESSPTKRFSFLNYGSLFRGTTPTSRVNRIQRLFAAHANNTIRDQKARTKNSSAGFVHSLAERISERISRLGDRVPSLFTEEKCTCHHRIIPRNTDREFFVAAVRSRLCRSGCDAPRG